MATISIVIAGKAQDLDLPALPVVHFSHLDRFMKGGNATDLQYVDAVVNSVYYSLRRRDKTIQLQDVQDSIDTTNFHSVISALMEANELKAASSGE